MDKKSMIKVLCYKAEHIKTKIKPEFFTEVADFLEKELSEDAISRKAVLYELDRHQYSELFCEKHYIDSSINLGMAHIVVNDLPPIHSQQTNEDHWVDLEFHRFHDNGNIETTELMCPYCREFIEWDIKLLYDKPSKCPNCGKNMIEPQESEE